MIIKFGGNDEKPIRKPEKSRGEKLAKSKKVSKIGNSAKFYTKKNGTNFLILDVRIVFNRL